MIATCTQTESLHPSTSRLESYDCILTVGLVLVPACVKTSDLIDVVVGALHIKLESKGRAAEGYTLEDSRRLRNNRNVCSCSKELGVGKAEGHN